MTMSARTLPMGSMLRSVEVTPVPDRRRQEKPRLKVPANAGCAARASRAETIEMVLRRRFTGELLGYVAGRGGSALYEW
jgi:hypothetical protein